MVGRNGSRGRFDDSAELWDTTDLAAAFGPGFSAEVLLLQWN
jgi:predicted naringenin-chalcone synthase